MRLLLLITDLELGGTPIVVRELATRLRSESLHVEVACLKSAGPVAAMLREQGIAVTSFEARRSVDVKRTIGKLIDLVRSREIETVLSFLIHANFVAARASLKLPEVCFLQSIQTTQPRPRWHWWLQGRIHQSAARVIVPSESVAMRAMERSHVPREKLIVIPNAVDAEHFESIVREPILEAVTRVGFVGRLDPVKRVPDLLKAIATLPGTRLDIFGDGVAREEIEAAILGLNLGNRVTLHGSITDSREAYAKIDVLVLPSDAEGFGLVLIEAMAAGVPVIGTDVDGIHDVVHDGETGLLVPPRNPAALARAIAQLSGESELRDRLISNGRLEVDRRFTWPAVIARYREVLQM